MKPMRRPLPLVEQFESGDEPAPVVADAPPIADPLLAELIRVKRENIELRAKVAQLESPPPRRWMALKPCAAHPTVNIRYETIRKWCVAGLIEAKKENGRIFVNLHSAQARLSRLRDK
jgi:hypothetical protein